MKITKFGHCCLLIEENGLRILTDPGEWNKLPAELGKIDVILITHEHADHLHVDSLKTVLRESPEAEIIANSAVGKLLDEAQISYTICSDREVLNIGEVALKAFETKHAEVYPGVIVPVLNTGFKIADRLFYPGDALYNPGEDVEILALPVAGPWLKLSEAIDYARELKPKTAFPVHDGALQFLGPSHALPGKVLGEDGTNFILMELNREYEI